MGKLGDTPAAEVVELAAGECRVLVCPGTGGAIARFAWRDADILRRASDEAIAGSKVRQMSCYPLVPYSNRIGQARLRFGTEEFALRPNFPPERHALHGVGWRRPWSVAQRSASTARLELAHEPDADWPFAFEASQSIALDGDGLSLALELRNAAGRPMPAGLGWHPYFPLAAGTTLESAWEGLWETGEDRLPREWVPTPSAMEFRRPRRVDDWIVDRCFTGWKGRAQLDYGAHRVELSAPAPLDCLVCYAPGDGRSFIALEPVSHVIDAFALAAAGQSGTGMRVLAPGETMAATMRIGVAMERAS